jgi:hypothetical protein
MRRARRRNSTPIELTREIHERALERVIRDDLAAEAKRQSTLAASRASDREALAFIQDSADVGGWK